MIKLYKNKLYVLSDNYLNKKISLLDFNLEKDNINKKVIELDNLNNDYYLEQKNDDKNRKVLNNLRQIVKDYNIDNFNKELFYTVVDYGIIGGVTENGTKEPYMIRFICKTGLASRSRSDITDETIIDNNQLGKEDSIYANYRFYE